MSFAGALASSFPNRVRSLRLIGGITLWLAALAAAAAALATSASANTSRTGTLLAPVGECAGSDDPAAPPIVQLRAMRCLVSWARAQAGLRPLHDSHPLDRSSLMRAVSIRRCQSFSHTACGEPFATVFRKVGYFRGRVRVGENIAWGSGGAGSARTTLQNWLNSPPHRENLLTRGWRDEGVNLVRAPTLFGVPNVVVWVLQFGCRG